MPWKNLSHSQRLGRAQRDKQYDETQRATTPALALAKKIRSSARWRRVRLLVLKRDPLCVDPFGTHALDGIDVLTTEVDHIVQLTARPDLAFEMTNLQGLCSTCHNRKSAIERAVS
jgi:5-methylcytosine-specific restriction protein A